MLSVAPARIVILTGSPGTGKTTTARAFAASLPKAVHLHTDDFFHMIISGAVPPYLPESESQNHVVMDVIRRSAETYAEGGFTVVIDGIIGPWMLDHFTEMSHTSYVVLRPSRAEALRRAQARTSPEALVDEGPVTMLWDQFADLGDLETHVIDTTDQSPEETLRAVQDAAGTVQFALN